MQITWDPVKAATNLKKHGINFADAAVALEDENALTILTIESYEYRYKTLAMSPDTNVLLIVHAEQDEHTIRIISARKAHAHQRRQYFTGGYNE